ncbi:hypothetical protein PHYPO_G00155160 [Pangasianodon hypophthalmus]|uniref:Uncharacterized protein n=1 Tax=Pangasianodon hypophthalmus TaxID=310915 RepID=A0A5N5JZW9_PANHP|nr:hypothetical protein PHYPO_G00155160 [Pangasianodon hypophthalmus]
MEKIPVPPYPGPPLESTSSVQQTEHPPKPAPRTRHITVECATYYHQQSPGPQHHGSRPMENIPVPPYTGPPQESVQPRAYNHQAPPQIHHTTAEGGPGTHLHSTGHQHHSSFPMENIPVPRYPGPTPQTHHIPSEGGPHIHLHSPGPQRQSSLPMENIPVPPYPGPTPQTHHIPSEGGPHIHLHSPGPQCQSSFPMENIPVPPYPGPTPQTHHIPSEGGPHIHLHSPGPRRQSSLPTENLPVRQYSGPPLGSFPMENIPVPPYPGPTPQTHHIPSEGGPHIHLHSPGPQRQSSLPMENIPVPPYPGPAPQTHHIPSEGGPHIHLHSPGPQRQSPPYMDKEKATLSMYPDNPLIYPSQKSQGCMQENMFAQPDSPRKNCTPIQGNHMSLDVTRKIKVELATEREKMSESLEQMEFTHVHHPQVEPLRSSQKTTEFIRHTTEYMKVSTDNVSSRAVQQITPDTPASMYSVYGAGAGQPRVQVIQGGGNHVIIQPPRSAVVVPGMAPQTIIQAAQPALVIQHPSQAVRVIQPQVLPTVIQPAANAIIYHRY